MLINARKSGFREIKEIPRDKKNTSTDKNINSITV